MTKIIETLLDGYESPVLLSDARESRILHINHAVHAKLGLSKDELTGMQLNELFRDKQVIQHQTIWEHQEQHYLVETEEITLSGKKYVKSNLKPFLPGSTYYLQFQKEMAIRLVHRLRSPLNAIWGFTELLKNHSIEPKQQQYVQAIEDGVADLKSVLDYIESLGSDIIIKKADADLRQLIQQLKTCFAKHEDRIQIIYNREDTRLNTDAILLISIIKELVRNAIQHGPQDASPIVLRVEENCIRVHNEGPPIPAPLSANIFYPFYSGKAKHVGIGLAKCAYYADMLGYNLKLAQNSEEHGVSFDLML